jgi:hypothetical protein
VLMRARIWAWAPDELKLRAWPKLKDSFAEQAVSAGLDPARAFPIPRGYVETKSETKGEIEKDSLDSPEPTQDNAKDSAEKGRG